MKVSDFLPGSALCAALLLAFASQTAHAFADDDARRAILDLREQVHQMNEQNRHIRLDFAEQLETLKQEIMSLRGQLEQLQHTTARARPADDGLEDARRVMNSAEQLAFDRPMDMFRDGKYQEAAAGFDNFLSAYPTSALAVQARFYRGSSQYAIKDFQASIKGLNELVEAHPEDARAPDALLIIATDQVELNELAKAKSTLERIVRDYPDSTAAGKAKERLNLL